MNRHRLQYEQRWALDQWLKEFPKMKEIYWYKEALHKLYRTRGYEKARRALIKLMDQMSGSKLKEVKKIKENAYEVAGGNFKLL